MKGILIALGLLFAFHLFLPTVYAKSDESIPKKRIVTLVYDDSSSMYETLDQENQKVFIDNWKYANYSLQSLVGLLDEQDLLYVVPMSSPERVIDLALGEENRQKEIADIRSWDGREATPLQSIHTAMNQLASVSLEHPEAELWLIVLTDGVFNELTDPDLTKTEKDQYKSNLEKSLGELTANFQKDEKSFHSALVTIESGMSDYEQELMNEFKALWKETTNGTLIESSDDDDIVTSIHKVAALITNRDLSEKPFDLKETFKDQIISFTIPFPLKRITMIEQSRKKGDLVSIKQITVNQDKQSLRISGPYRIRTPEDPNELSSPLSGSVTHFLNPNTEEAIPAGEVTIRLGNPLSDQQKENLRFIAEPAIDFSMHVARSEADGQLNDDPSTFFVGSKMQLDVAIKDSETNHKLEMTESETGLFEVTAFVEGQELVLQWNAKRQTFSGQFDLMEKNNIEVKTNVRIKGLYQKEKTTIIHGYPIRELNLTVVNPEWSAKMNELEQAPPMELIPTIDGNELNSGQLAEIWNTLKVDLGNSHLTYDLTQKDNHILFTPQPNWLAILTPVGKIPVTISLDGIYPKEHAEVTLYPFIENIPWYQKYLPFLLSALAILLFLFYMIGLIIKPRFKNQRISIHYHVFYITNGERFTGRKVTEDFKGSFVKRWLIPYLPETKTIGDLTFKATKKSDKVVLTKGSQTPDMIVADEMLGEQSSLRDIQIFNNDEIVIRQHAREEHYIFRAG